MTDTPWPTDIRLSKADKALSVTFESGETYTLSAEYLRVESPSAEVQGHSPDEKKTVWGKKLVGATGVEEVGNYAIRIIFNDGHDSGIYTWDYLYSLGKNYDGIWATYLKDLEKEGLSRDPEYLDT